MYPGHTCTYVLEDRAVDGNKEQSNENNSNVYHREMEKKIYGNLIL